MRHEKETLKGDIKKETPKKETLTRDTEMRH